MTAFFSPKNYSSFKEISTASILDAVSNSSIDGRDVFGYVGPFTFYADYVYDVVSDATYAVAITAADACPECGKSLFEGICRWTDCGGSK